MFSGIVEEMGVITQCESTPELIHCEIQAQQVLNDVNIGDSIAVNGTCLTVTKFTANTFSVDIVPETMRLTNLKNLKPDTKVNLERSVQLNQRISGHIVQGHVDGTTKITQISNDGEALMVQFAMPAKLNRYIAKKGFIAIDGMSLTVVSEDDNHFTVTLIPHTCDVSIAKEYQLGTLVNLEVDILSKYLEKLVRTS